jgi:TolB protein
MLIPAIVLAALAQPAADAPEDWKALERPHLRHAVQLTSRDQFIKAGEAYFSPDGNWIIFQAVPAPKEGQEADPFYAMYVAKLTRDRFTGLVSGLEKIEKVSPDGSANTCGWFHPRDQWRILFGSTLGPPAADQKSGFQVGTRRYVWMFPDEMEIVTRQVQSIFLDAKPEEPSAQPSPAVVGVAADTEAKPVFTLPNYDAECSWSPDGRFILYAHVEDHTEGEKPDANIYVYDTETRTHHALVTARGYDGGPFFSPDGRMICYRSDRKGDDLLQLFVAELKFENGVPVGIEREHQLTDNEHVNWCPFWHPSGKFLVYGTSEVGHHNYEVFAIEFDESALRAGVKPSDLKRTRITYAPGADILPAFSPDGKLMMWTSQRGPRAKGEEKPSSQLWIAEWAAPAPSRTPAHAAVPTGATP